MVWYTKVVNNTVERQNNALEFINLFVNILQEHDHSL